MGWDSVLLIVFVLAAVVGIAYSVHKQRHQRCEGEGGCSDCPLADTCNKAPNHRTRSENKDGYLCFRNGKKD